MPLGRRKLPTPVLSGSGSRVFLSPTRVEHPCFNNTIETPQAWHWQMDGRWMKGYRRTGFLAAWRACVPLTEWPGLAGDAWAAMAAMEALERTSSMACWARAQTGCAGQRAFLGHDRPCTRQMLRQMEPSMASITSRIDASRPRCVIRKPPDWPRCEVMSPERARVCNTLDRKLSGAPVACASEGSKTRPMAVGAAN